MRLFETPLPPLPEPPLPEPGQPIPNPTPRPDPIPEPIEPEPPMPRWAGSRQSALPIHPSGVGRGGRPCLGFGVSRPSPFPFWGGARQRL